MVNVPALPVTPVATTSPPRSFTSTVAPAMGMPVTLSSAVMVSVRESHVYIYMYTVLFSVPGRVCADDELPYYRLLSAFEEVT